MQHRQKLSGRVNRRPVHFDADDMDRRRLQLEVGALAPLPAV